MPSNSNWFLQFFNDEEDDYTYNKDIRSKPCNIPKVFVNMVYLINSSNGAVSDDQCNRMVEAINIQLESFCEDWSMKPVIVARSVSPPSGSYQIILTSDSQYTIPGAFGYHMRPLADGTVKAYISVNAILPTGTTTTPNGVLNATGVNGGSVSKVVSHELLEMLINPGGNKSYFANMTNLTIKPVDASGKSISGVIQIIAEVGDAVSKGSYIIITSDSTRVQVSDYVLPSWFSEVGKAPFNYNNTLQGPFLLSTGGYYEKDTTDGIYSINFL